MGGVLRPAIGWTCIAATTLGIALVGLDFAGVHVATARIGFGLMLGGLFVSDAAAIIDIFFFTAIPRRYRWEWVASTRYTLLAGIEHLLGRHVRRRHGFLSSKRSKPAERRR